MNQNVFEVGSDLLRKYGPALKDQFQKALKSLGGWVKDEIKDIDWDDAFEKLKESLRATPSNVKITNVELDYIDKDKLIELAKKNIVPNSNEVVAMLNSKPKNAYYIYIAYAKDKELLPNEENNFLIIKVAAASKDLQSLFGENELIILK